MGLVSDQPTRPTRRAEALDAFAAAGYDPPSSPSAPSRSSPGASRRDDFTIDTARSSTVTCPAGHTKAVVKSGASPASAHRAHSCPLRRPLHHLRRRAQRHRRRSTTAADKPTRPAGRGPLPRLSTGGTAPCPNAPSRRLTRNKARRVGALPRRRRQPPLAPTRADRRQPRAPHQPRRHPQQRRHSPSETPARRRATPTPPAPPANRPLQPSPHRPAATPLAQGVSYWCFSRGRPQPWPSRPTTGLGLRADPLPHREPSGGGVPLREPLPFHRPGRRPPALGTVSPSRADR